MRKNPFTGNGVIFVYDIEQLIKAIVKNYKFRYCVELLL